MISNFIKLNQIKQLKLNINKKSKINECAVVIFNRQQILRGIKNKNNKINKDLKDKCTPPQIKEINNKLVIKE